MIKSMTGYGSAKGRVDSFDVTIEVKSVNNKFLDCNVRMPRGFLFAEETIKNTVQKHISRGKVDVFVNIDHSESDDIVIKVNESLARGYYEAIKKLSDEFGISQDLSAVSLSKFPDVLSVEKKETDSEVISAGLSELAEKALCDFDAMRLREGSRLKDDILEKLAEIESFVTIVETEAPKTAEEYRQRLEEKMKEILGSANIDQTRIITEAAIYADHIAVDEETVRLRSHISQLKLMLDGSSPIGRKIDFLVQEFNREANTIGSKCQNADIAHIVVDLKSDIEKIREQIQNIE